jgi:membrane-anchored mycosin MYCP
MSQPADLKGEHKAYSRPEIAVASKHLKRVLDALQTHSIAYDPAAVDDDEDLGLALIPLADDVAAAWALRKFDPRRAEVFGTAAAPPKGPTRNGGTSVYLDSLLRGLRGYFATEYAGWKPLVGKNRLVGYVTGAPGKVTHGSDNVIAKADSVFPARTGSRGTGVRVAVLDSAMSPHPWLAGAWTGPASDVLLARPIPNAEAGHGTFVAGLILRQAPNCVVDARQVLDAKAGEATSWKVAKAIVAMARTKPDIINLSLVCYTEDGEPPMVLATAIDRVHPDTVIVAAAGNHGNLTLEELKLTQKQVDAFRNELKESDPDASNLTDDEVKELLRKRESRKPGWPAAFDRVVAVGSAGAADDISASTPHDVEWIDVLAPGDEVTSTFMKEAKVVPKKGDQTKRVVITFSNRFARWSGTSFAAAKVSGRIAARTVPGKVSAARAWATILEEMQAAPANTRNPIPTKPYFLGDDPDS